MRRKLLGLTLLLGITVTTFPPPAHAATCTTQPFCDSYCPTASGTGICCCPHGSAAGAYVTTCRNYSLGICDQVCPLRSCGGTGLT